MLRFDVYLADAGMFQTYA